MANQVAPHAGAWIETNLPRIICYNYYVAPHAGAWIETEPDSRIIRRVGVAPHAGAWIETMLTLWQICGNTGRPSCGGVD